MEISGQTLCKIKKHLLTNHVIFFLLFWMPLIVVIRQRECFRSSHVSVYRLSASDSSNIRLDIWGDFHIMLMFNYHLRKRINLFTSQLNIEFSLFVLQISTQNLQFLLQSTKLKNLLSRRNLLSFSLNFLFVAKK